MPQFRHFTFDIFSHLEHITKFTLSADPHLAVVCFPDTLWLCMYMTAIERESVGREESVRQTSFYHWGVEGSVNCSISAGESITHLEVRRWERWGSVGALLWIIMDYGWKREPWLADSCDVRSRIPLHVLKDSLGCTDWVDESDCEPLWIGTTGMTGT